MPVSSRRHRRRGVVLVTALWITIILTAVVMVLARSMRVEGIAARNRLSSLEADAIERGAEQYVLSQVEAAKGDAIAVSYAAGEAIPVGDPDRPGYFWLLRPDPASDQLYGFGIVDESGKLSLNKADVTQLTNLPGMNDEVAQAIVDWRADDVNASTTGTGAESDYYLSLPQPYAAKNNPFETVEELKLIKGVTPEMLYGFDSNRDGVIDPAEQTASTNFTGTIVTSGGTQQPDSRGIFNYVTCYTAEPNTATDGSERVNVNSSDTSALLKLLTDSGIDSNRAAQIMTGIQAVVAPRGGGGRGGRGGTGGTGTTAGNNTPIQNLGQFYTLGQFKPDEFAKVADKVTTTTAKVLTGLVNINTAPRQVLAALPNMTEQDADALVSARAGADTTSFAWMFTAIDPTRAAQITGSITTRSYFYSADIVAVSADGRAFRRVRIVVDGRTTPAKIVYRRDLTGLGWPLDRTIQAALRASTYTPPQVGTSTTSNPVTGAGGGGIR